MAIVHATVYVDCTAAPADLHVQALVITPVEHMQHSHVASRPSQRSLSTRWTTCEQSHRCIVDRIIRAKTWNSIKLSLCHSREVIKRLIDDLLCSSLTLEPRFAARFPSSPWYKLCYWRTDPCCQRSVESTPSASAHFRDISTQVSMNSGTWGLEERSSSAGISSTNHLSPLLRTRWETLWHTLAKLDEFHLGILPSSTDLCKLQALATRRTRQDLLSPGPPATIRPVPTQPQSKHILLSSHWRSSLDQPVRRFTLAPLPCCGAQWFSGQLWSLPIVMGTRVLWMPCRAHGCSRVRLDQSVNLVVVGSRVALCEVFVESCNLGAFVFVSQSVGRKTKKLKPNFRKENKRKMKSKVTTKTHVQ